MQEPERHGVMDWIWPILVLFLALGVRSWYLVELTGSGRGTVSLHVQDERPEDLSRELELLAEQKDFFSTPPWSDGPERTAHAAPGHVFFMLGFWKLPPNILLHQAVSWTQCVLGALTALCYCLLARRVFRSQAIAVVAGLLCALHPFWIVNVAELNDGVLASFLLALCLLLGSIGGRSGGAFTSLAFGLLLALLCLVRAALLPFAFVGLLWYLWQCRTVSRSWLSAALVFLGFINGLVPWAVRNFQHFHDVFPVVDSTYYHLWIGNNPQATGGPMPEGPEDFKTQALAQGRDEDPDEVWQEMEQLDQPSRYNSLAPDVVREVNRHPAETLRRRLWAGLCFWFGQDWLQNDYGIQETEDEPHWLVRAWPAIVSGTLLAMLALAALGWRWSNPWAREGRLLTLAVVFCFLPYLLSHGEGLHGPRLPLDGVLLTYAAIGIIGWLPLVQRWGRAVS